MHCHSHILIRIAKQCCTVFACSEASLLSTDQIHEIKLPDVGSVLGSIHALDQAANFVFAIFLTILCGKSDVDESLGCSLEMCSADVIVSEFQRLSFVRQIHDIMIETSTFHCREQLRGWQNSLNQSYLILLRIVLI